MFVLSHCRHQANSEISEITKVLWPAITFSKTPFGLKHLPSVNMANDNLKNSSCSLKSHQAQFRCYSLNKSQQAVYTFRSKEHLVSKLEKCILVLWSFGLGHVTARNQGVSYAYLCLEDDRVESYKLANPIEAAHQERGVLLCLAIEANNGLPQKQKCGIFYRAHWMLLKT